MVSRGLAVLRERGPDRFSPPPSGDVLIVSPHFDDAILSTYALIAATLAQGHKVTVLTVFAGRPGPDVKTTWDELGGFANAFEAITARAAEETAAFDGLNVERRDLDCFETMYRNGTPLASDRETYLAEIRKWLSENTGYVAVPSGAGGPATPLLRLRTHIPRVGIGVPGGAVPNVDHLWVTDTLIDAISGISGIGGISGNESNASRLGDTNRILLYEDVPYLWAGRGDKRVRAIAEKLNVRSLTHELPVDRKGKTARIKAYESQVPGLFCRWVTDIEAVIPKTERYWTLVSAEQ
jgi:hypothetical protein